MELDLAILEQIEAVGSRNAKIELLAKLEAGKDLLSISLDPGVTFGVTLEEEQVVDLWSRTVRTNPLSSGDFWIDAAELLRWLMLRKLSGNAAYNAIDALVERAPTSEHARWFARLVNKDLRCGIQVSSLNKVWPGIIEPFQVQLALQYDPSKHKLDGEWAIDPKLDGLRMTIVNGVPYTRNGRVITSCQHIIDQIGPKLLSDYVFDGEVMGGGLFDEASGKVRKKDVAATHAKYHVFDMVPAADWATKNTEPYRQRLNHLAALPDSENVVVVQRVIQRSPTNSQLLQYRDAFIKDGFEGIMLKDLDAPYQFKRSKSVLKFKDFASEDCEVIELIEGKGKYKNMLGAVRIKMDSGVTCEVGTGFNDAERKKYWETTELIGRVIEVQHQEPKTAEGRMRFPSFMRIRPDKE